MTKIHSYSQPASSYSEISRCYFWTLIVKLHSRIISHAPKGSTAPRECLEAAMQDSRSHSNIISLSVARCSGFWNLLGLDTSNHITLCLLQKNWECWVSPCPGEIVKGALERTVFSKANKNFGRRLCWKQSYAWEIWLCVFSDHKRSGHQFSIAS